MSIIQLISLSVSVILVENLILEKRFGMGRFPYMSRKKHRAVRHGLVMLGMMPAAMALAMLVRSVLPVNGIAAGVFALAIAIAVGGGFWYWKRWDTRMIRLAVCGANCVMLGLWMLTTCTMHTGLMIAGSMAAAVVFVLTALLFETLHQRLRLCDCPRSFRGVPMEFVTAALLLMACMGLR